MAKEKRIDYFSYFSEISAMALKQAQLLRDVLTDYNSEELLANIGKMHALEHEADMKKAELIEFLIKDFLPPIDRDDIMELADLYDSVCDAIDDVLMRFYMYNVAECRDDTVGITDKIVEITEELNKLTGNLKGFSNPERLISEVIKVNDIEEEGDQLYLHVMNDLFSQQVKDPQSLLAWEKIYSALENCFDSCENVADEIRNVIIKNS